MITTGGVSMGELDLLKPVLERQLKATIHFGRLAMKPGKPATFATVHVNGRKRLVFSLPGNPVSALVTYYLLVLPALHRMSGVEFEHTIVQCRVSQSIELDARPEYQRCILKRDGSGYLAELIDGQQSSRLQSMTCHGLLRLPASTVQQRFIPADSLLDVLLLQV